MKYYFKFNHQNIEIFDEYCFLTKDYVSFRTPIIGVQNFFQIFTFPIGSDLLPINNFDHYNHELNIEEKKEICDACLFLSNSISAIKNKKISTDALLNQFLDKFGVLTLSDYEIEWKNNRPRVCSSFVKRNLFLAQNESGIFICTGFGTIVPHTYCYQAKDAKIVFDYSNEEKTLISVLEKLVEDGYCTKIPYR